MSCKSLEPVGQLRAAISLVCQLGDQECERLGVTRDPQWSGVHRIEPDVMNQLSGNFLALRFVPTVHETWFPGFAPSREHAEQYLAWHRAESRDHAGLGNLLGKLLRARRGVSDDERGIIGIHRKRAADDDFARQVARLFQDVVDSRPMHGQQKRVRILRGLSGCSRSRRFPGLARESVQLLLAARIAEYDVVPGTREDRAEFATH